MAPAREAPKPKVRLRRDGPSLIARTKQKAALEETYSEAVTWCLAQGCSTRKALSSGLFDEGLSRSTLQRRLKDDMRKANTTSILTTNEENDLVEWVQEKNREHGGVLRARRTRHPGSDSAPGWRVGAEESAPATMHFWAV